MNTGGASSPPFESLRGSGWALEHHAIIDSTNVEAHRRIASDLTVKTVIWADRQTAGCGRHSRVWESAATKGLWASLVLPVSLPLEILPQSTLVLAVAVREAVANCCGIALQIKWPNDLLHEGRKCCGLLVESAFFPQDASVPPDTVPLILGAGLNINHLYHDFPSALRDTATSLRLISDREHSPEAILRTLLASVDHWFGLWASWGFAPVREAWLGGNCTLGKRITLPEGFGHAYGTAHDLAPDGALVALADNGDSVRIDAGEIFL